MVQKWQHAQEDMENDMKKRKMAEKEAEAYAERMAEKWKQEEREKQDKYVSLQFYTCIGPKNYLYVSQAPPASPSSPCTKHFIAFPVLTLKNCQFKGA